MTIFISLQGQNQDYWLRKCDTSGCGYADKSGRIQIEIGKYHPCFTDTMYYYAIVLKTGHGFVGIDKSEKDLFQVWPMDNGPDYVSEGLFRIIKNDKIGFANEKGQIVIPPQFEMVYPFYKGLASFCVGCVSVPDEQIPEYTKSVGGFWGFINKNGEIVNKPEYKRNWNKELREFQYEKGDSIYILKNKQLKLLK